MSVHPDIAAALRDGRPVVALESAVVTSGLPRAPGSDAVRELHVDAPRWRNDRPVNLEAALLMHRAVRDAGAIPAMIAVIDGALRIGLDANEIERLALDARAGKASTSNLAACCAAGETAGTTVSASLAACKLADLRVFATGGIGGVHRAREDHHSASRRLDVQTFDISPDLIQLSRSPVLTVCSGAKSILDIPATLEALETLGVPVLGWRTDRFPQFYSEGSDDITVTHRVESAEEVAAVCRTHWDELTLERGILLANPVPGPHAINAAELEELITRAERSAVDQKITGPHRTPFLLAELAGLSRGRTLRANIALLESNARLAAEIAAMAR